MLKTKKNYLALFYNLRVQTEMREWLEKGEKKENW